MCFLAFHSGDSHVFRVVRFSPAFFSVMFSVAPTNKLVYICRAPKAFKRHLFKSIYEHKKTKTIASGFEMQWTMRTWYSENACSCTTAAGVNASLKGDYVNPRQWLAAAKVDKSPDIAQRSLEEKLNFATRSSLCSQVVEKQLLFTTCKVRGDRLPAVFDVSKRRRQKH